MTADLHRWVFDEHLAPLLDQAARGQLPREEAHALLAANRDLNLLNEDLLARLQKTGYAIAQSKGSVAAQKIESSLIITGDHAVVYYATGSSERSDSLYVQGPLRCTWAATSATRAGYRVRRW